ncbi:MAG: hypothetical protein E7663_01295 [Ruminococcaceae bacterium]|nr:hypothetical protein [Oscillospiraceae bacterium]
MKRQLRNHRWIVLVTVLLSLVLLFLFAGTSFSKYEDRQHDRLMGEYVGFCLSHTGGRESVVLTGDDMSGSVGFRVSNEKDGEISKREIRFQVRTPGTAEIAAGEVVNAWGDPLTVTPESAYYDVVLTDVTGKELTGDALQSATSLTGGTPQSTDLYLRITRRTTSIVDGSAVPAMENIERLTVVIETSVPYQDVQVFEVRVSNNLVVARPFVEEDPFGFSVMGINLKTSSHFNVPIAYEDGQVVEIGESFLPVKLVITPVGDFVFDEERFRLSVEGNLEELSSDGEYTRGYYVARNGEGEITQIVIFMPSGGEINTYFYHGGGAVSIKLAAYFKIADTEYKYENDGVTQIMGLQGDGTAHEVAASS